MTDLDQKEVRRRQRSRSIVMGLALAAFVILLYLITIARMGAQRRASPTSSVSRAGTAEPPR